VLLSRWPETPESRIPVRAVGRRHSAFDWCALHARQHANPLHALSNRVRLFRPNPRHVACPAYVSRMFAVRKVPFRERIHARTVSAATAAPINAIGIGFDFTTWIARSAPKEVIRRRGLRRL